jgi:hypothetical protein
MVKQTWKGLWLSQKSTIHEIGIICACSHHGQPRYQIWIKCDKRQMTSCLHKMCRKTYGQTNMKRAITLAKINHPWNRHNMRMLRSWPTMIPNMNKLIFARVIALFMFVWPYVRSHILCTQLVICLLSPWNRHNIHMLRSWSTKRPNINKMRQKTND